MARTHELEVLRQAVRLAGQQALKLAAEGFETHIKKDRSPVTTADLAVNQILHERLLTAFPHDAWLSEETPDDPRRLENKRVWVIDPIDGTKYFMRGVPQYAISVALVEAHQPRSAMVYALTLAELVEIDRERFLSLVEKTPRFALAVMQVLSRRLRRMDERYEERASDQIR